MSFNSAIIELQRRINEARTEDPVRPNVDDLLPEVAALTMQAVTDHKHPIVEKIESLLETREQGEWPKQDYFRPRLGVFDDEHRQFWQLAFLLNVAAFHSADIQVIADALLLTPPEVRELAEPAVEGDDRWAPATFAQHLHDALTLLRTPVPTPTLAVRGRQLVYAGRTIRLGRDQAKVLGRLLEADGRPVSKAELQTHVAHLRKTCSRLNQALTKEHVRATVASVSTGGYVLQTY